MQKSPYILCIEDDPTGRDVLRLLFERRLGYEDVEFWETSELFEERLMRLPRSPELILLDMKVSHLTGSV